MNIPASWSTQGLVVLLGAGLSIAAPADVPSWWQFNDSILTEMKTRVRLLCREDPSVVDAVEALNLESIGVERFSQHVHDAFAGAYWFEAISVLDGDRPNAGHLAVARLSAEGIVRLILTTNFDTLLERAFNDIGAPYQLFECQQTNAPSVVYTPIDTSVPIIVKLHGTVHNTSSLVDLAHQKSAGLPEEWRSWLAQAFSSHAVLVAGFSGRDLDLSPDYLGLFSAAHEIPELRWLSTDGQLNVRTAKLLLDQLGNRGAIVTGKLPDYLATALGTGMVVPIAPRSSALQRLNEHVQGWFQRGINVGTNNPEILAVCLGRMIHGSGQADIAKKLRSIVRSSIKRELAEATNPLTGLAALLIFAQLGVDEIESDAAIALSDLQHAGALQEQLYYPIDHPDHEESDVLDEQALNRAAVAVNIANAMMGLNRPDEARPQIAHAQTCLDSRGEHFGLSASAMRRQSDITTTTAAYYLYKDDPRTSALVARRAVEQRRLTGGNGAGPSETWAISVAALGEKDLAEWLLRRGNSAFTLPDPDLIDVVDSEQLIQRLLYEGNMVRHRMDEVASSYLVTSRTSDAVRRHLALLHDVLEGEKRHTASFYQLAISEAVHRLLGCGSCQQVFNLAKYALNDSLPPLGPVMVDALATALTVMGLELAQVGVDRQAEGRYADADIAFARAVPLLSALKGMADEAARANLYRTDALLRLGERDRARDLLRVIVSSSSPAVAPIAALRLLREAATAHNQDGELSPADQMSTAQVDALVKVATRHSEQRAATHWYAALAYYRSKEVALARSEVAASRSHLTDVATEAERRTLVEGLRALERALSTT